MGPVTLHGALVIAILCAVVNPVAIAAEPTTKPVSDFSEPAAAKQWISVNDDVMGGVSTGGFRITDDKTLQFSGTISLENRGGFASIRTQPAELGIDGFDTIAVRVKGDGRTYQLDLRAAKTFGAASYRAFLQTQNDTWQEIRVPVKDFEYSAFGKRIVGVPRLTAAQVQSVGFTLADKQAGPFRLEVAWIRAEKVDDGSPAPTTQPAE